MCKPRIMAICLILSLLSVPCQAESLAQAYRARQRASVLCEPGEVTKTTCPGFREDLGDLSNSIRGGLGQSFSRKNLVYLGLGTSLILATYAQDDRIGAFFERNHPLRRVSRIGDISGTVLNSGIPAIGVYCVGRLSEDGELTELGKIMFATSMVKWWLSLGLICSVRRERPETENLSVFEGGKASFPSGHVAGGFATATVLNEFYGPKIGIPAYLFAGFVGLARLEDNKHYASDVVGGAVVGTLTALAVSRATRTRWARISAAPVVEEKRAGLVLVYQF